MSGRPSPSMSPTLMPSVTCPKTPWSMSWRMNRSAGDPAARMGAGARAVQTIAAPRSATLRSLVAPALACLHALSMPWEARETLCPETLCTETPREKTCGCAIVSVPPLRLHIELTKQDACRGGPRALGRGESDAARSHAPSWVFPLGDLAARQCEARP